ncbi:tRNA (adenosine(37)-N6)-dimethylallyltransferase MiaA [Candidatus Microgenomates bacterium]|nr:tRNA (adenosine(37)-N6)-dimethylallyltransferase MiaA [Candidatus Microgenomates bacterium]
MNKLLVICGPTATGKTALGINLAKKFGGEIISADSRQVYKGMDVITGKDIDKDSEFIRQLADQKSKFNIENNKISVGYRLKEGIPVWLVDIVEPDYSFNAGEYASLAHQVNEYLRRNNKLPIAVGGTGLYIKALTSSLPLIRIPPNFPLRKKLDKMSREELGTLLKTTDLKKWEKMNQSDRLNPRRLIRAIEVVQAIKNDADNINTKQYLSEKDDLLFIGLRAENDILYRLIDKRVEERYDNGAAQEIQKLKDTNYDFNLPSFTALGYRIWDEKGSKQTILKKWKYLEHAYARRQMTWFKKEKRIIWFDITNKNYLAEIEAMVGKWYTGKQDADQN